MKFALVIAVAVCAVSCLQPVNADGLLPVFQSPEIQTIAINIIQGFGKIKATLMNHMNMISSQANMKHYFQSYKDLVSAVTNAKPGCVSDDEKIFCSKVITTVAACFPDQPTLNAHVEEGQKAIAEVLNKLKDVDQGLLTVSDPVLRADIVAQADMELAGGYFVDITTHIMQVAEPAKQCIENAATTLRSKALANIHNMITCYNPNQ